jgi:amino acid permease
MKKIIYAISTLSGTIIGVGLFSLPYITSKVGIWLTLGYFAGLGAITVIVHSFFGETAIRTPDFKRMPGFAKIYLGNWGRNIALISTILGLFAAILAYLIVGGEFLAELLSPFLGGGAIFYTLCYFLIGAAFIYFGIKAIVKVEFWGLVAFFVILIAMYLRAKNIINVENLFIGKMEIGNFFLPYGAVLFSIWGAALIPEIEEMLAAAPNREKLLRIIIPISILIPIIVYLFFIYLILGITGEKTTESALVGLRNYLGNGVVSLALIFGLLTTFTSFLTLGLTLKKVFWYDLGLGKRISWFITCFAPLFLYLIGIKSFIAVIGFAGGVMIAIEGILILLMHRKINPKKKFITYPLIAVFLAGIIYSIAYFFH